MNGDTTSFSVFGGVGVGGGSRDVGGGGETFVTSYPSQSRTLDLLGAKKGTRVAGYRGCMGLAIFEQANAWRLRRLA